MKFELNSQDIQLIGSLQKLFSELPMKRGATYYRRLTALVKKINNQIPDKIPTEAKRRIRIITLDKDT